MATTVKIVWNPGFKEGLMGALTRRMQSAGSEVATRLTSRLGQPSPPPARIGAPPHRVTGTLQRAVSSISVTRPGVSVVRLSVGMGLPRYGAAVLSRHPADVRKIAVNAVRKQLRAR